MLEYWEFFLSESVIKKRIKYEANYFQTVIVAGIAWNYVKTTVISDHMFFLNIFSKLKISSCGLKRKLFWFQMNGKVYYKFHFSCKEISTFIYIR